MHNVRVSFVLPCLAGAVHGLRTQISNERLKESSFFDGCQKTLRSDNLDCSSSAQVTFQGRLISLKSLATLLWAFKPLPEFTVSGITHSISSEPRSYLPYLEMAASLGNVALSNFCLTCGASRLQRHHVCMQEGSARKPSRVLVTGGANGIGRACVDAFLLQGDRVAYADLQASGCTLGFGVSSELTAPSGHFIKCDVTDPQQVEAAVQEAIEVLGGVDVLVNNVGAHVEAGKPCHEVSVEAFDQMVAINLRSHFLFCKFCLRDAFLQQPQGGSIVNVGSVHGFQNGPGLPAYAACKGGILALTRQLAVEYASSNVRVNCVVPGTINTPMNRNFMEAGDELTDRSPMGRWGRPQELADVVTFLAGEGSSFVTGQSIAVDGGLLAKGVWADNERPGLAD